MKLLEREKRKEEGGRNERWCGSMLTWDRLQIKIVRGGLMRMVLKRSRSRETRGRIKGRAISQEERRGKSEGCEPGERQSKVYLEETGFADAPRREERSCREREKVRSRKMRIKGAAMVPG